VPDADTAWAWFGAELWVLLSAVERAGALGADAFAWRVMHALHGFLGRQLYVHEALAGHRLGLAAAQRLGDLHAQSQMHRRLAGTYLNAGRYDEAEVHLREAIRCGRPGGDVLAEAHLRRGLAYTYEQQGRLTESLEVLLEIHPRIVGHHDSYEVGRHLSLLGKAHHNLGEHARALELCLHAAEKFAETDFNGQDEGPALNLETLGEIHLGLGRYGEAVGYYERSLEVWRQMRDSVNVAEGFILLGTALHAAGEKARARQCAVEAERVIERSVGLEFEHGKLERVRELLAMTVED
jgi:tetratricopeptide (TPR) repeat protein